MKYKRDVRLIKLCQYTSIIALFSFTSNDFASYVYWRYQINTILIVFISFLCHEYKRKSRCLSNLISPAGAKLDRLEWRWGRGRSSNWLDPMLFDIWLFDTHLKARGSKAERGQARPETGSARARGDLENTIAGGSRSPKALWSS